MSHERPPIHDDSAAAHNEADELLGILAEQMTDPHVERIHGLANSYTTLINEKPSLSDHAIRRAVHVLDQGWQYLNKQITITAPLWIQDGDGTLVACLPLTDQQVVSRGFTYQRKLLGNDLSGAEHVPFLPGHYVVLNTGGEEPRSYHGVAFLDDLAQLSLPHPSEEMRQVTFRYYHPEVADTIDRLRAEVNRPDQFLMALGELQFRLDETDSEDAETLHEFAAYLEKCVQIDRSATYRMGIRGAYATIPESGSTVPAYTSEEVRRQAKLDAICLLPTLDGMMERAPGVKTYIPYLHCMTLEPAGPEHDQRLLVPCNSLTWIGSNRYDTELMPNYRAKEE
jgi:hypothetical protein